MPYQTYDSQPGNPYVKTEFRKAGTLTAITDYSYNRNGLLLSKAEYDWIANLSTLTIPTAAVALRTTSSPTHWLLAPQ